MGDMNFFDISTATMKTKPIGSVDYGESRKFKITNSSPNLETDGNKGKYEIFHVSGTQGRPYFISVVAICDCLGFRKQSIIPIIYLLKKNGEMLQRGTQVTPTAQYVSGKFPSSEDYFVLIIADTTKEGESVGRLDVDPVRSISIALTAANTGTAFINWEKKTP
ncbi:MAG: hypothetical protein CVU33_02615 [Betaproteobacteria bacterium HGW-Betaproteobacteria-6]|nr:MAG: hypothetical protein CVU33_02615 [Betaproteobacteria bacterium HGW-Betaproteobacteria-6]